MHVLVVEDNRRLAGLIAQGLREEGWKTTVAHDGDDGLRRAAAHPFDAIILDWMMPRRTGIEVLQALRERGDGTPVLMLTARADLEDRVSGLDAGADDYLSKPFEFDELFARLRALVRRARGAASNVIRVGGLEVDTVARSVLAGNESVELSAREYAVLECLVLNRGRVLTRDRIFEHVYAGVSDVASNVIDVYIGHLRRKLKQGDAASLIHTRRGLGYVLEHRE